MLHICDACTTAFAYGSPNCPNCGSPDFHDQGEDMPTVTRHGGASNEADNSPDQAPDGSVDTDDDEASPPAKKAPAKKAKAPKKS